MEKLVGKRQVKTVVLYQHHIPSEKKSMLRHRDTRLRLASHPRLDGKAGEEEDIRAKAGPSVVLNEQEAFQIPRRQRGEQHVVPREQKGGSARFVPNSEVLRWRKKAKGETLPSALIICPESAIVSGDLPEEL